jgi:hypothetical protein
MKSIELIEEHKSKLLEMCKILFPEMFVVTIQENGYLNYSDTGKTIEYEDKIHWFEFCMTHLVIKLNISKEDYLTLSLKCTDKVNYLYEKFKKLK